MAGPFLAAAEPRAGGNSPSATNGLSETRSSTPVSAGSLSNASGAKVPNRPGSAGFPKSQRLLKRSDFRRVYDEGTRLQCQYFALFRMLRQQQGEPRVGFSVPRALGKAVARNRIRRRMREAVRQELWRVAGAWDLIFHPRKPVEQVPFPTLRREVERMLAKCGTS
jgi:ribonuclease P protein component